MMKCTPIVSAAFVVVLWLLKSALEHNTLRWLTDQHHPRFDSSIRLSTCFQQAKPHLYHMGFRCTYAPSTRLIVYLSVYSLLLTTSFTKTLHEYILTPSSSSDLKHTKTHAHKHTHMCRHPTRGFHPNIISLLHAS